MIRKRRLRTYVQNGSVENNKIFDNIFNLKSHGRYTKQTKEELGRVRITGEGCQERNRSDEKFSDAKVLGEDKRECRGRG